MTCSRSRQKMHAASALLKTLPAAEVAAATAAAALAAALAAAKLAACGGSIGGSRAVQLGPCRRIIEAAAAASIDASSTMSIRKL